MADGPEGGRIGVTHFRLENSRLLEITLQGERVMTRAGAMVAYDGQIKFEKSILGGEGLFGALKRRVGGEGFDLMTTSGSGRVYVAQNAAEILLIPLNNDRIFIESNSVLAFDDGMRTNTVFAGLRGASSGQGLFTTTIEGTGNVHQEFVFAVNCKTLVVQSSRESYQLKFTGASTVYIQPSVRE